MSKRSGNALNNTTTNTTTLMIAVSVGAELPVVGGIITCASHLTGIEYAVRVTSLQVLRWLPNGDLEVTVRGTKGVVRTPHNQRIADQIQDEIEQDSDYPAHQWS